MLHRIDIDPTKRRECWVAHLDLLGASRLLETQRWEQVFLVYAESLEQFWRKAFDEHLLSRISFSDSFILYTADGSALSYRALDSFVRSFVVALILRAIPVRGAMSFGYFYADSEQDLVFGQALLDAYRTCESQDWLGFILCKSVVDQLSRVGLPAQERLNYASWPVPLKGREKLSSEAMAPIPAFILGAGPSEDGQRACRDALLRMKSAAQTPEIRRKYENTLQFLVQNVRS